MSSTPAVDSFLAMTSWLALSLGLWLGQAPEAAPSPDPEEAAALAQSVQRELDAAQQRAQAQERLRTQRLELIQRAAGWLLVADEALAVGELDVSAPLGNADVALAQAEANAEDTGRGQSVLLIQSARFRLAFAVEAAARRDISEARWALFYAGLELNEAYRRALNRPDTFILTPPVPTPLQAGGAAPGP